MKLAFSTLACPQWSTEQIVENARRLGYDALELRLLDGAVLDPINDAEKVKQAVSLSRANGVEVCTLDTSCSFNHSDATLRERHITDLRNWIQLAQEVQVPLLRVFGGAGKPDTYSRREENAWVADSLRQVAQEAEQAQITVVLETHDGFASARRSAEVLNAVDSPAVSSLWDSHHPYRVGESVEEVIQALDHRIAHVHVKDARRTAPDSNNWQLVLLGEGEVPVHEQLQVLQQHGYQGYVSVEWEKKWHPEIPEPEIALPQHIALLKQWLA